MTALTPPPALTIGVLTYRRPEMLRALLASVARNVWADMVLEIQIVDNDVSGSGRAVVDAFRAAHDIPVGYQIVPDRNMALLLNRLVDAASHGVLLLLDDDMEMAGDFAPCLRRALATPEGYVAWLCRTEVKFGDGVSWLQRRLFTRGWRRFAEGAAVPPSFMHSGGAILFIERIRSFGVVFDERAALIGGYDVKFFTDLHAAGAQFAFRDQLVVREVIPPERATVSDQLRRAFSTGTRLQFTRAPRGIACLKEGVIAVIRGGGALLLVLPVGLFSPRRGFRLLLSAVAKLSYIFALFGHRYEYYR